MKNVNLAQGIIIGMYLNLLVQLSEGKSLSMSVVYLFVIALVAVPSLYLARDKSASA